MKEPWIQTYTGKQYAYFECGPEQICIEDIARALSNLCRFTGHCKKFYSVAQHSVLVSHRTKNPFLGLMHDADEAYKQLWDKESFLHQTPEQIQRKYPRLFQDQVGR